MRDLAEAASSAAHVLHGHNDERGRGPTTTAAQVTAIGLDDEPGRGPTTTAAHVLNRPPAQRSL
jgi:hypothetical protein